MSKDLDQKVRSMMRNAESKRTGDGGGGEGREEGELLTSVTKV